MATSRHTRRHEPAVAPRSNYQSLVPKASETIVSLSASGDVCIFSSRQTHLLADAVGYFSSSSTYLALTPARLLETRPGGGSNVTVDHLFEGGGPGAAGSTLALTVSGRGGVPAGQHTVVLDVAVVGSPGGGFLWCSRAARFDPPCRR